MKSLRLRPSATFFPARCCGVYFPRLRPAKYIRQIICLARANQFLTVPFFEHFFLFIASFDADAFPPVSMTTSSPGHLCFGGFAKAHTWINLAFIHLLLLIRWLPSKTTICCFPLPIFSLDGRGFSRLICRIARFCLYRPIFISYISFSCSDSMLVVSFDSRLQNTKRRTTLVSAQKRSRVVD